MEENNLKDKWLICKDCGRKFVFTVKDQMWFGQKGFPDPVRCAYCRRQKKILMSLKEGVSIKESVEFVEICDKCGRKFYSNFRRKSGEKIYCEDCWREIKYVNPKNRNQGEGMVES